ncbi:MAG: hypothetical protein QM621_10820 [Aeromicrobium sp.]|uniref:DUF7937 domain-containing protein n=1 Tax=Aeromicrobium sp. TaxID=1871063 RepID=UPI0039E6EF4E
MTSQPPMQPPVGAPVQPSAAVAPQQVQNPFSGLPLTDVLRDVAALILLITALFYDWSEGDSGAELWFVDVATAFAVLGLLPSYLSKLGVFGPAWQQRTNGLIRLGAAVPYFISVLVVVILDLADDRGVGVGVGVGLFAALLAAQPRKHELPPASLAPSDRIWVYVTGGLVALAALFSLLSTLLFIDDLNDVADAPEIIVFVLAGVLYTVLLGVVAVPTLLAKPAGVALTGGLGSLFLVLGMFHIDGQNSSQVTGFLTLPMGWEGLDLPGFGGFLVVGAAAAAFSPGASRATGGATHPVSLAGAAKWGFVVLALAGVLHLLGAVFRGIVTDDFDAPVIVTIIFSVLIVGVTALGVVTTSSEGSKVLSLAAAGGYMVLTIVLVVIVAIIDEGGAGFVTMLTSGFGFGYGDPVAADTWLGALLVGLLLAFALVGFGGVTKVTKKAFENAQAAGPATGAPLPVAPAPTAPIVQAPASAPAPAPTAPPVGPPTSVEPLAGAPAPVEPPAAPVADPVVQRASDPTVSQAELADLVQNYPQARAAAALNPQAYPGMLEWLGQLNDPEINAALAQRQQG